MFIQALLNRLRVGNVTQDYPLASSRVAGEGTEITSDTVGTGAPELPAAFVGLPVLQIAACQHCGACTQVCPTQALQNGYVVQEGAATPATTTANMPAAILATVTPQVEWVFQWSLDRGKCIACGACIAACPSQAIVASGRCDAAVTAKNDLALLLQHPVQTAVANEEVRAVAV